MTKRKRKIQDQERKSKLFFEVLKMMQFGVHDGHPSVRDMEKEK
jgi:hypothetical protein